MAETRRLSELVDEALKRLELPAGPVTVALSGGADSAALALLAGEAGAEPRCVHVDHGLTWSPLMRGAAEAIASHLGLTIEMVEVTVHAGPSPEGKAREARYSAFETVTGPLLTGHTLDDNAETVLINLVRGTGARGLSGIPRLRPPNIHRPMLAVGRSETREMATLAGLPFVDDPMNEDPALARNRIRRTILPRLAELNPRVIETIARTGDVLARDSAYIDAQVPEPDLPMVAVGVVNALPRPVADRLLVALLDTADVAVTSDRMSRVWGVVRGEAPRHDLADGKCVVRRGAMVIVE